MYFNVKANRNDDPLMSLRGYNSAPAGRVGIGTTAPAGILHLQGFVNEGRATMYMNSDPSGDASTVEGYLESYRPGGWWSIGSNKKLLIQVDTKDAAGAISAMMIDQSRNIEMGPGRTTATDTTDLRFKDGSTGNYVGFKAPLGVTLSLIHI